MAHMVTNKSAKDDLKAAGPAKLAAAIGKAFDAARDTLVAELGDDLGDAAYLVLLGSLQSKPAEAAKAALDRRRTDFLTKAANTNDQALRTGYTQLAHSFK